MSNNDRTDSLIDFSYSGLNEVYSRMDTTINKINKDSNEALRIGAELIKDSYITHTPVHKDGAKHPEMGHAKDRVEVGNVSSKGGMFKEIKIGYNYTDAGWRMWFLEEGTKKLDGTTRIKAQHNVKKAVEDIKPKLVSNMADTLKQYFF